jgi:hypothetical protein
MADFIIKPTTNMFVNHVGLTFISKFLNSNDFYSRINSVSKIKKNFGVITDYEIVKTVIALVALGKTNFEAVEQYRKDKYFKKALKLKRVPSSVTIRQRLETYGEEMFTVLRQINTDLIKNHFSNETVKINDKDYVLLESDVTPMDNSDSKKEGVAKTYKLVDGYAPMMSYAGRSGFMVNNELRNGDCHSNCDGTDKYFTETIGLAKQLCSEPLFSILDSGNDDSKLVEHFKQQGTEFIIKRNLRRESKEKYIEYAIEYAKKNETSKVNYVGSTTYYSNWTRETTNDSIPIAVIVTEKTINSKGQRLLLPDYEVDVYWNSLDLKATEVEELYHKHGTSEQYHSEFKSDMDMERLPSGKFSSNYGYMLFGMLAFNLLRITGKALLETGQVPGKRGNRLRLRTVIQNIMYMAGQYVEHAHEQVLKVYKEYLWTESFIMIMR